MSPRGFTLIELLVVIAIISLLISLLVPSLATAKALARETACLANMRAIGQASAMYSEEQRSRIPPVYGDNTREGLLDNWGQKNIWGDLLVWGRYGAHQMFQCPSDQLPQQRPERLRCSYGQNRIVGDMKLLVIDVETPTETILVSPSWNANPKVSIHDYRKPRCDTHRGADNFAFIAGNAQRLTFRQLFNIDYDPSRTYAQLWSIGWPEHSSLHPACNFGWQNNDHEKHFRLWNPMK